MSYTDPSGFFFKRLYKALMDIGGVTFIHRQIAKVEGLGSAIQIGLNYIPFFGQLASAHFAFDASFVATGSLSSAFRSGGVSYLSSMALQSIGGDSFWGQAGSVQNILANAMVGGVSAELLGGKFGHGFFAAGFTSAFKPMVNQIGNGEANYAPIRVLVAATIGGTASVISGGKFTNGAVTGAFVQMFNGETALARQRASEGQKNKLSTWYSRGVKYANEGDMADSLGIEGKTVIVFGKRGLGNFFLGAEGPIEDFLNHEAIHEHAFVIQNGALVYDRGFSSNGLFTETKINFTGFGYSSYAFTDYYILPGNVDVLSMLQNVPGNWMSNNYVFGGPTVNNCQSYADSLRRHIEVTYGTKK